jgi:hypothetical protein
LTKVEGSMLAEAAAIAALGLKLPVESWVVNRMHRLRTISRRSALSCKEKSEMYLLCSLLIEVVNCPFGHFDSC